MIQISITCEKAEQLKDELESLLKQLGGKAQQTAKAEPEKPKAAQALLEKADGTNQAAGNEPGIDVCRSVYFDAKKRGISNDEVKKVLASLGAEKISSIPEGKRAAFIEAVKAMER